MKRISFLILALISLSLACSMTAYPGRRGSIPTLTNASKPLQEATATPARICARVISQGALHLRQGASENSQVLGYLQPAEVVQVVNYLDSKWWRVADGNLVGYARSIYLEEFSCDERKSTNGKK